MAWLRSVVALGLLHIAHQNIRAEEGVVTAQCCSQVFLSSSGLLADTQSAVLGIYTKTNTKIANNSHPVYVKHEKEDSQYYLYFRNKEGGPQGWIVGKELLEDSFFITTRNDQLDCANGIFGGFDRGQVDNYDNKFSIVCHSDQVKIDCCKNVHLASSGVLQEKQGAALGDYAYAGDFNGHPYFKGTHNMFLFYRKKGSGPDGWMISTAEKDENLFSVTTRQNEFCPTTLTSAYDRDRTKDDTFTVTCQEFRVDEFSEENDFSRDETSIPLFDQSLWILNDSLNDPGIWIMNGSSMNRNEFSGNSSGYNLDPNGFPESIPPLFQSGFFIKVIEDNEIIAQNTVNNEPSEDNEMSGESTVNNESIEDNEIIGQSTVNNEPSEPSVDMSSSTEYSQDVEGPEQDPGASLEPIPPSPINSSTRETMVKSVCFRLLLVIYIAISN